MRNKQQNTKSNRLPKVNFRPIKVNKPTIDQKLHKPRKNKKHGKNIQVRS